MVFDEQDSNEGLVLWSVFWWDICPEGCGKKEITLTFQKYAILDAKRQWTASVKVETDLCQGRYLFSTECIPWLPFSKKVVISNHSIWLLSASLFVRAPLSWPLSPPHLGVKPMG